MTYRCDACLSFEMMHPQTVSELQHPLWGSDGLRHVNHSLHRSHCSQMDFLCLKEETELLRCSLVPPLCASSSRVKTEERRVYFEDVLDAQAQHQGSQRNKRMFSYNLGFYPWRNRLTGKIQLLLQVMVKLQFSKMYLSGYVSKYVLFILNPFLLYYYE